MNLLRWWFERKNRHFDEQRKKMLDAAIRWQSSGYEKESQKLKDQIEKLDSMKGGIEARIPDGWIWLFWSIWSYSSFFSEVSDSVKPWYQQIIETVVFVGVTVFSVKYFWFGLYVVPTGSAEPNILVGDRICGVKYPYFFKKPDKGDLIIFNEPKFNYSRNKLAAMYQKYIGFPILGLPAGPMTWVKRLIADEGDMVYGTINDQTGRAEVYVNGKKIDEPYLNPYPVIYLKRQAGFFDFDINLGPLTLPTKRHSFRMLYTFDPSRPYDDQPFYNFTESEIEKDMMGKPLIKYPEKGDPSYDRIFAIKVPKDHVYAIGDNRHNSHDSRAWGPLHKSNILGRASFILYSLDGTESWWFMELLKNPITFLTKKMRWSRIMRSLHPFVEVPKT